MIAGSNRITHVQFFQTCEEMRNCRETIEKECQSYTAVALLVNGKTGFNASETSIRDAMKTVGIKLAKKKHNGYSEAARIKTSRVLTKAVVSLFQKLGEPVPEDLKELADRLQCGIGLSTGKPINPVPVSTVIDPKTMKVVNK